MTLLMAGKSERALFVITLPGSSSLLWREEGLAPSSIRSDKGKCVKGDGFQSGEEKEAHLIFRWGLSICPRMKMSFRRMETYMPGDELRKASSRLGFSRLGSVDPYLYRPYKSATVGGRGVC